MTDKPKILVIDDDENVRFLLSQALGHYGFRPILAADGQDGLSMLERNPDVAVVLLDWMMPRLDGLSVARAIHKQAQPPPVVMMTARSHRKDVIAALQAGACDYVTKPLHMGQLVLRITNLLEAHKDELEERQRQRPMLSLDGHVGVTAIDISETGCSLETTFPVPRDAILYLQSDEINHRLRLQEHQIFPVRVASCKKAGKKFKLGVTFVWLSSDITARLRSACVSSSGFRYTGS